MPRRKEDYYCTRHKTSIGQAVFTLPDPERPGKQIQLCAKCLVAFLSGSVGRAYPEGYYMLTKVRGIGPPIAEKLYQLGVTDLNKLVESDPDILAGQLGLSARTVVGWQTLVKAMK